MPLGMCSAMSVLLHTQKPAHKVENRRNSEELIPQVKDWNWLNILSLSSAASRWTGLRRPQHRALLSLFQHSTCLPTLKLIIHLPITLISFRRNIWQNKPCIFTTWKKTESFPSAAPSMLPPSTLNTKAWILAPISVWVNQRKRVNEQYWHLPSSQSSSSYKDNSSEKSSLFLMGG